MITLGICLGLAAALLQSFSYVFSRRYAVAGHGGAAQLLIISHCILALVAGAALPLFWHPALLDFDLYGLDLLGAGGWYLIGQFFMFVALKQADASRVSPLLGLKIAMVAIIWTASGNPALGPWQWTAVGLSVAAAFVLNYTGGSLPFKAIGGVAMTCFFYALSDVDIVQMIAKLEAAGMSKASASAAAACGSYLVCGVAAMTLLPKFGSKDLKHWRAAVPFSASWFFGMALFFPALATAGVVLGNIALATRGLFSIALGAAVAAMGHEHLEQKAGANVVARRILAALMMMGAIALYAATKQQVTSS